MINRYEYTTERLEGLPTMSTGQVDDLKAEVELGNGRLGRVWLSRCGVDGGEPWEHTVSLEVYCDETGWRNVLRWNGDNPDDYLIG